MIWPTFFQPTAFQQTEAATSIKDPSIRRLYTSRILQPFLAKHLIAFPSGRSSTFFFALVYWNMFHTSSVLSIVCNTLLVSSLDTWPSGEDQTRSGQPLSACSQGKNVRYEETEKRRDKRDWRSGWRDVIRTPLCMYVG